MGSNESVDIGSNRNHTVGANEMMNVALTRTHTIGINDMVNVGVAQEISVGAIRIVTVGVAQMINVGMKHHCHAGNEMILDAPTITIEATKLLKLKCGAGTIEINAGGEITIQGPMVKINC